MATIRPIARTRSSVIEDASPAGDRFGLIRSWRSDLVAYGSHWEEGETLRPHPWSRPGSTLLRDGGTPSGGAERPSGGPMAGPRHDRESLARLIGPRFVPHCCVGIGGMAEVWMAEQVPLHRLVAVKVLPPGHSVPELTAAFHAEALIASHLSHPNILPVYDADDRYLVMQFVEGLSLAERLEQTGRVDLEALPNFIEILIKVSDAAAFAHGRGVVHCDLKPQNVMLGDCGEVLVMDWGLAICTAQARDDSLRAIARTAGSRCAGTPGYMAPEMARRSSGIDDRCDVFLLGAMLYEILTGFPPFPCENPMQGIMASVDNTYHAVAEMNPQAPQRLIDLQQAAMASEPGDRMGAREFADALRSWMGSSRNEIVAQRSLSQARALIDQAALLIPRRHRDWDRYYACYREALLLIDRALTLIGEHPAALALRRQALDDLKIGAVSAGELFLARLLAGGDVPPSGSDRLPAAEHRPVRPVFVP